MTIKSDVHSTRLAASGSVYAGPARVKLIHIVDGASAGSVVIRDGGASGTVICTIDTPGTATGYQDIPIPENGLRCETNVYCEMTNVTAVTVFYG